MEYFSSCRILEKYILYGEMIGAVEQVIADLSDRERQNRQELDLAVAGQLNLVLRNTSKDHRHIATTRFRNDWGKLSHYLWVSQYLK